jgi:LmbE family N-acetylglucosaminyl deacetylase
MQSNFEPFLDKTRPLFLRTLDLDPSLRVVVLAPHPDDFDAIGITMRTLRDNGNPIDLVVLTSGASGVDDDFAPKLTAQGKAAIREQEQRASCNFFGLAPEHLTFLHLAEDAEGHPELSEHNLARLRAYWDMHLPELVFMPHGNDTNAGHQRTYRLFRQLEEAQPRSVVALLNRDPKTIGMRQDVYTLFGETEALWKGELLRFHRTQHERNMKTRQHGIYERILRVNRQVAEELGGEAEYAEVFELEWYGSESTGNSQ